MFGGNVGRLMLLVLIQQAIRNCLGIDLPFSPKIILLCWFQEEEYLLSNLITAASMLFAKVWKLDFVPTLREWKTKSLLRFFYI